MEVHRKIELWVWLKWITHSILFQEWYPHFFVLTSSKVYYSEETTGGQTNDDEEEQKEVYYANKS